MREALAIATSRGSDPASTPIGCVIVRDEQIIGFAHNECQTLHDATALALRDVVLERLTTLSLFIKRMKSTNLEALDASKQRRTLDARSACNRDLEGQ